MNKNISFAEVREKHIRYPAVCLWRVTGPKKKLRTSVMNLDLQTQSKNLMSCEWFFYNKQTYNFFLFWVFFKPSNKENGYTQTNTVVQWRGADIYHQLTPGIHHLDVLHCCLRFVSHTKNIMGLLGCIAISLWRFSVIQRLDFFSFGKEVQTLFFATTFDHFLVGFTFWKLWLDLLCSVPTPLLNFTRIA